MYIPIIFIFLFIGLGLLFSFGKGAFLIAGYNTLPKAEKAKYDTVALCKFMGKLMFVITACILFWLLDEFFPGFHLFAIGQTLLIVSIIFAFIYANTGNRFKQKNLPDE